LAQFFIELQLQTALLGNDLAAQPRERIRYAANFLGLSVQHFAQLEALLRWRQQSAANGGARAGASGNAAEPEATPQRIAEAYGLLECKANDRDEQVVKAYRRQMSKHHPDKLQANGLPESMLERAKERTQQIQAAYELIRRARGMS
jgi:DnaJ like chaperone protein